MEEGSQTGERGLLQAEPLPRPLLSLLSGTLWQPAPIQHTEAWLVSPPEAISTSHSEQITCIHDQGNRGPERLLSLFRAAQRPLKCDRHYPIAPSWGPSKLFPAGSLQGRVSARAPLDTGQRGGGMTARQTRSQAERGAQRHGARRATSPILTALLRSCGRWAHCGL